MDMEIRKRQPIGVELVKRGIVTEADIEQALQYQREHPSKKIGDMMSVIAHINHHYIICFKYFP